MPTKYYFDNAATTPVREEVLQEILPYFREYYGNASSIYSIAKESKKALEAARAKVAAAIGATPDEIYFTAGGSESDNMALRGVVNASKKEKKHIITTKIEHHAILHTAEFLETKGVDVTYLNVDEFGKISLEELENAIRPETVLISVMFANNEIGTIQPIAEIAEIAKKHDVLFHTDAVQAVGHVPIDVEKLHVDLLSMSGHKLGAPKGIGAIYIRKGTRISPLIFDTLGVYFSLICVNSLLMFSVGQAQKKTPFAALKLALRQWLGATLVALVLGLIRELTGSGSVWGVTLLRNIPRLPVAQMAMGGFILMGFFAALCRLIHRSILRFTIKSGAALDAAALAQNQENAQGGEDR